MQITTAAGRITGGASGPGTARPLRREAVMNPRVLPHRPGRPEDFARPVAGFLGNTVLNGEAARLDATTRP